MKEKLIITDLTRMQGERVCLSGYTPKRECVRPELSYGHFSEPWLYLNGRAVVRPFAVIEWTSACTRPIVHTPKTG